VMWEELVGELVSGWSRKLEVWLSKLVVESSYGREVQYFWL